jgi:hypothetical protein
MSMGLAPPELSTTANAAICDSNPLPSCSQSNASRLHAWRP